MREGRGATTEESGSPAGSMMRQIAVQQHEDEEHHGGRHHDAEEDPNPNGCQSRASSTFALTFRATFSTIDMSTASRIRPSAPSTRRALTSLPRINEREAPWSNTTASVFCTDDITPVAPHSASPSATTPATLHGEGTALISASRPAAPSGERSSRSAIADTKS